MTTEKRGRGYERPEARPRSLVDWEPSPLIRSTERNIYVCNATASLPSFQCNLFLEYRQNPTTYSDMFTGHASHIAVIVTITSGCTLGSLSVIVRLFTRTIFLRKPGWDDVFILAGCVRRARFRSPYHVLTVDRFSLLSMQSLLPEEVRMHNFTLLDLR